MNFMENKTRFASYDASFRRNVYEICQKCALHFPDVEEFKKFSEEISQLVFLKNETVLDDNEREIIRTFYLNNEKVFLVCHQLWRKFDEEFLYLDNRTIKFAIFYELNNVQNLLTKIKKLVEINARVTVFAKTFF